MAMNDLDESLNGPYILPRDLISLAQQESHTVSKSLEAITGGFLTHRQETALVFQDGASEVKMSSSEVARFLRQLTPMALDSALHVPKPPPRISFAGKVGTEILRFIELFFDDLRRIICKGNKDLSGTSKTAIVAIASWLTSHLGVGAHIATAVATAILVSILTATKGAFCKMTAENAKAAIASARTEAPKRSK
jgi:hypothetical protein